ncbi:hypothetical protein T01_6774 [Trichinella spiralis]|uniref:Uncharacterized protein n=1 Tax=Trichinella spiralis TaxID=6334 RepID=A0A0V1AZD3_TRISP|nr:hypothetical protein T01_6774 [Trichinella spiralis]
MSFRHHHYTCECRPHGYLVNHCIDQQSRSALSFFPQYHLHLDSTEESMRNLLNNW